MSSSLKFRIRVFVGAALWLGVTALVASDLIFNITEIFMAEASSNERLFALSAYAWFISPFAFLGILIFIKIRRSRKLYRIHSENDEAYPGNPQ